MNDNRTLDRSYAYRDEFACDLCGTRFEVTAGLAIPVCGSPACEKAAQRIAEASKGSVGRKRDPESAGAKQGAFLGIEEKTKVRR